MVADKLEKFSKCRKKVRFALEIISKMAKRSVVTVTIWKILPKSQKSWRTRLGRGYQPKRGWNHLYFACFRWDILNLPRLHHFLGWKLHHLVNKIAIFFRSHTVNTNKLELLVQFSPPKSEFCPLDPTVDTLGMIVDKDSLCGWLSGGWSDYERTDQGYTDCILMV